MSQATLGPTPYNNSNLFSGYYLEERVDDLDTWDCDDEAEAAFEELQRIWELEFELVESYKEDELLSSWIDEVLDVLGFGTLAETTLPEKGGYNDRLLFESDEVRRDASLRKRDGEVEAMYGLASAVLEAKQWGADFTKRFAETRSYRDASHQIKYYLEHTPERLQWGILTDGKKWRLYGTKDYATETYYEVDLPELLMSGDLQQFKYFYLFFRPEAFREVSGTSFLETVWNESETAAQELGEDLQDNVFTALRVLGEGFIETNNLSIDPDDAEAREELKEQSLVLLYRLMFVLYGESRDLISPDEPGKQREFEENFSLDELRYEIHDNISSGGSFDEYSAHSTSMWGRLQDLFRLVDSGEESLGVPPYNGGLFDGESHSFLERNEVSDRYIAEVVYRLGTTRADDGDGFVLADYADLDTRHLGTIYEGLLEHEFRIAPEQYAAVAEDGGQVWKPATDVSVAEAVETVERGELYVVNDDGERKATGAYYTPDYVVAYIVEETIDPLLADIKEELQEDGLEPSDREYFARFWQSVLDLTVLDPAMGSGHFLTKATGYLTERVMEVVREQEIQSYDEQDLRRQIAKECIYGVDVNGMAVELAKLSMWLETLAADKPLAFLDHHLKAGNSLVGSDITEVLSDDADEEGGQLTLMQAAARVRRRTLEHVMELMQDLLAIDNERLEDIKSMEELYDEIRDDPLYGRLFELANVHTAERFGLDVPKGVYEEMAGAIEDGDEWAEIRERDWFISAQAMTAEEDFFHWELEYPEVFFDENGKKRNDAGFNAVIGNPPYVRIQSIKSNSPETAEYILREYNSSTGNFDIYMSFNEVSFELTSPNGLVGFIQPHKFFRNRSGENLRRYISERRALYQIVSFGHEQVFEGASVYTCVLILSSQPQDSFLYADISPEKLHSVTDQDFRGISEYDDSAWIFNSIEVAEVLGQIKSQARSLEDLAEVYVGLQTSADSIYLMECTGTDGDSELVRSQEDGEIHRIESEILEPFLKGEDVGRYESIETSRRVIFPYEISDSDGVKTANFIHESVLKREYPNAHEYLKKHESALRGREGGKMDHERWYDYVYPKNLTKFEQDKILTPEIGYGGNFTIDKSNHYHKTKVYGVLLREGVEAEENTLLALLNSNLLWFFISRTGYALRGGYFTFKKDYLYPFGIPSSEKLTDESEVSLPSQDIGLELENTLTPNNILSEAARVILRAKRQTSLLNLELQDHLGNYDDGPTLAEVGFTQPPKNAAESILQETSEDKPNLRVGYAEVHRESESTVEVRLTARYKPDDDSLETDQWGYTETEPLAALRITDLSSAEADLIEAFVPLAVDEAGGFANFRETVTKTNSLVDRLRGLTLPRIDDVRGGLESYIETKERAEELEEKIERTDDLIDEIVYELYGLSDEEIGIVEEAIEE